MTWNLTDIPNLTGKVAVVTGGNIGLGYLSTFHLAKNGAHVVIACRNVGKGRQAERKIKAEVPNASLEAIPMDLVDSETIHSFTDAFSKRHDRLDILLNNAGVVIWINFNAPQKAMRCTWRPITMVTLL